VYDRLKRADRPVLEEGATTCCYAQSEKSWIEDPQGVKWETFLTTGDSTVYGTDEPSGTQPGCCEPATASVPRQETCCAPAVAAAGSPKLQR